MKKLIKILVTLALSLVILSLALVFVLFVVVDPNRYRPALESLVAQQTGWDLTIAGDINWTFRPVFGLSISDVRLSNGVSDDDLASFSNIALKLVPSALLRGDLDMQELVAEDLHVNWIVEADGQSNWLLDSTPEPSAPTDASAEAPLTVNIDQITIRNASLRVRDVQQDLDLQLENLNLTSRNANLDNRPFPLQLSMRLLDHTGNRDLTVQLETRAALDLNAGNLQMNDMELSLNPLVLTGDLAVNDFTNDLRWQTNLSSNTFALADLLQHVIVLDEDALPPRSAQQFTLHALNASGDSGGASLRALEMTLDNTPINLSGDIIFPADTRAMMVTYNLDAGAINLDHWLPAGEEPGGEQSPPLETDPAQAAAAMDEELPFAILRDFQIRGQHNIESLTVADLTFAPLQFDVQLQDGVLALNTQPVGFYDGLLSANLNVNASSNITQLSIDTELGGVNASALAEDMPAFDFMTGQFNLITSHTLQGNSVSNLLDSVTGASQMIISDSSVDITLLKQAFSAISVLSPSGDMTAGWPDEVQFTDVEAYLVFNDGLRENQELNVRLDNVDIAGTGGVDLDQRRFDYRMNFTILGNPAPQTVRINEDYQNIAWPIRCNAAFDDSSLQYCNPDLQSVRDTFARMARDEIEQRATEVIDEQVDRLRNRLRGLLD